MRLRPAGVVEAREAETRAAAQVLGCAEPLFARHPDRHLPTGAVLVAEIVAQVRASGADTCAPSLWEVHPDHRVLAEAAIDALEALGAGYTLVQYEVGMPLLPNVLVDITPVLECKHKAMACFVSQLAMQAYDRHVQCLERVPNLHPACQRFGSRGLSRLHSAGGARRPLRIDVSRACPSCPGSDACHRGRYDFCGLVPQGHALAAPRVLTSSRP